MEIDNKIFGIQFKRSKKNCHKIILLLEKDIPALGYGHKEIRKLLKQMNKK
jgi:hypothetical protein